MYLISLYFDENTDKRIRQYIRQAASASGNSYMVDANVPPHITISAFECQKENDSMVIAALDETISGFRKGELLWPSAGQFFPNVLFLSPVLNEYLHSLSVSVYDILKRTKGVSVSRYYRPFQWLPHTTIAKKLESQEMIAGFSVLQKQFHMFRGQVVRIGLAKTNPYEDIFCWELK